ncbi:ribosome-inactivating family protein [Streptomyces sp. 796.1]|uniref:ribosome-inactivating family protein n=1 Tax=Streptomyces sp. 796.1 TaxID=3163029 RepID=UPI0039C8E823
MNQLVGDAPGRRLRETVISGSLAFLLALVSTVTVLVRPAAAQDEDDNLPQIYLHIVEALSERVEAAEQEESTNSHGRRPARTTSSISPSRSLPYDLALPRPTGRPRVGHTLLSLDALHGATNMPSVSLVIDLESMYVMGFYQVGVGTHRFYHFNDAEPGNVPARLFGAVEVERIRLPFSSQYSSMGGDRVWDRTIYRYDLRDAVRTLGFLGGAGTPLNDAGPALTRLIMTLVEGARFNNVRDSVHTAFTADEGWRAADYQPYINNWAALSESARDRYYHVLRPAGRNPITLYLSWLRANLNFLQIPKGTGPQRMCSAPGAGGPGEAPCAAAITYDDRRAAVDGMPDWTGAGYRGGSPLPDHRQYTTDPICRITPEKLADSYEVKPDDDKDDSAGLQRAIDDVRGKCSGRANFDQLSLITLPAGRIDISRQISVDADYLVIRGQGNNPAGGQGTRIVFRPDADTRYDTLSKDGSRWDPDAMTHEAGADTAKGGWMWPGRGLFRVQTREVAARYADEWAAAPANRKDLYEGSINQHWASGVKLRAGADAPGYAAKEGGRVIHLDAKANLSRFQVGGHLWVGAANSRKFYEQQGALDDRRYDDLHMRQQVFRIDAVDAENHTVTIDKPLEFDLPVDSTSDGSLPIGSTAYTSKVTPLKMVVGVGFEDFSFTQDMPGLKPEQAKNNYGNLAPEAAMNGLVFKWAADSWARGVRAEMTGSHPIVTEVAKNLQFESNYLDGAWNKGKGGNGYFRGSRVWDSLYAYNTTRNLRHFTLQWSASGNVVYANDFDSDLNLHGGWERRNLFENNTVRVPFEHYSGNCTARCGGEGGDVEAGTWYPIWWAAGEKAVKWAGSSGPQNVFHNNVLAKQLTKGGPYVDFKPYGKSGDGKQPVFQFGSSADDPGRFRHLTQDGAPILDWNGKEGADYASGDQGVNTSRAAPGTSVFLRDPGEQED